MGGSAFAAFSPPLPTPRMPPEIYDLVLSTTHSLLKQHYREVASPIEGPGKTTFGDVDILLFGPLDAAFDPAITNSRTVAENLARNLEAKKWIKDSPTMNFAIPWPKSSSSQEAEEGEKFIQLDIHICHSRQVMQWQLFHAAHGDLWNILGSTIRRFGLTVNDRGLFLRIPDIEAFDRKKSMVFLTAEPNAILEFLRLEAGRWWVKFASREEMFEYAAGCRMFWLKEGKPEEEQEGDVVVDLGLIEGQEGGTEGKKKLKHNDRQRMAKRPIFAEWIEEFIPKCREQGRFGNVNITREEIRDDAFKTFGIGDEYENRRKEWVLSKHRDDLWRDAIKAGVPEDVDPPERAAAIRTLKLVIMEGQEFDGMFPKAGKKDEEGFYDAEEVKRFVGENWKRAGEIGMARQQVRALETMKAKAARLEEEAKKKRKLDVSPS